jgi:hypothetical protein
LKQNPVSARYNTQPCFTETVYDTKDIHCVWFKCLVQYNFVNFRNKIKPLNVMERSIYNNLLRLLVEDLLMRYSTGLYCWGENSTGSVGNVNILQVLANGSHWQFVIMKWQTFISTGYRTRYNTQPCFTETVYDTKDIHCVWFKCLVQWN